MSAPDRIYIHTGDCDDTYYELSDCCDDEVDYIRTDIHEAEITALKAEIAALKAPPKVLSAEEIKWSGVYRWRDSEDAFQWDWVSVCEFRVDGKREFDMFRFGDNKIEKAWGQFIGPIKMPEV